MSDHYTQRPKYKIGYTRHSFQAQVIFKYEREILSWCCLFNTFLGYGCYDLQENNNKVRQQYL